MKEKTWHIREYEEGDEKGINELFENIWGKPIGITEGLRFWNWQYKSNPFGDLNIILGVDHDKIVGQYTVVPIPMIIDDNRVTGSLSLHTIVHPAYQHQGMLTAMAKRLYEILKEKDIPLTYGFPNGNSIHGLKKHLEWKEILKIPLMAYPINFKKSASMMFGKGITSNIVGGLSKKYYKMRYRPLSTPSSLEIYKIDKFSKEFDLLWDQVKKNFGIGIIRDSDYLNWRFVDKPEHVYDIFCLRKDSSLAGYAVTYNQPYKDKDIQIKYIMDLIVKDFSKELSSYLISYCTETAIESEVDIICSIVSNSSNLKKAYKKLGYITISPEKLPDETHFGVRKNTSDIKSNVIFDPNKWYISLADTPGL